MRPWFKKKADPISDRARALNQEIARLEAQIQQLDTQLQRQDSHPRLRSTVLPHGAALHQNSFQCVAATRAERLMAAEEPIFEAVDRDKLSTAVESVSTSDHYNELGVRKYDLPALLRRLQNQFRRPATTNSKLVSYLAAGGLQGLRPLRYEKRVARNRFIVLVTFLFLMLLGALLVHFRHK